MIKQSRQLNLTIDSMKGIPALSYWEGIFNQLKFSGQKSGNLAANFNKFNKPDY